MIEAFLISICIAVVLGLIAICVLRIIDSKKDNSITIKRDYSQVEPGDVVKQTDDIVLEKNVKNAQKITSTRVRIFGVVSAGILSLLAGRVAFMQLFNKEHYEKAANDNQFRTLKTPAARGKIVDRHGKTLVYSKNVQTVVVEPDVSDNRDTLKKLSALLGLPFEIVRQRALSTSLGAQNRRVIIEDATERDIAFILEHTDAFPGVFVESRSIRTYPYGALAAHVLGYTGYPTQEQVNSSNGSLSLDDTIGKSGVESQYDSVLSGEAGERQVRVDANGNIVEVKSEVEAMRGSDVVLSLDAHAQYVADSELSASILAGRASTGAVVCLNIEDGGVVVMSSFPTFDPNAFTGGIPSDIWELYSKEESQSPMLNRTISSQYAPGSTMKAFSAMAGLKYGYTSASSSYYCTGKWDGFNSGLIQKCWLESGHKSIGLHRGIVESCDVVFYEIAKQFFDHGPDGTGEISAVALQDYYEQFLFGRKSGIDLADEAAGLVPTPDWKAERWRNVPSEATFKGGDYTNMIIGQGYLLTTPLQIACGYMAIANEKIMKPHVLKKVKNSSGDVVLSHENEVSATPELNKTHLEFVQNALHEMATTNVNVARGFRAAEIDAAGKTGTAEHTNEEPDALFVAYAPATNPKYVCACVMQHGSSGEETAAPIVAKVLKAVIDSDADSELSVDKIAGYAGESLKSGKTSSTTSRTE